ncbi:MAG: RIP metalloprotease RseP, partial [Bdellovibrionales bacterium]|nr:RIP metalloprotease RseP [Bdellovibrionales bacterium]
MEIIVGFLQQGFQFVFALVVLLGILVFVHEMGHFLVAKYFGVRVEVFSLGFGKKLYKRKYGDTEYCLSLIPLGGYVKMYGDDPTADVPENMKKVSFLHKPVGQRIWIVLAGPLMNLFFAILLFSLIAVVGEEMPKPIAGDISPMTEAAKAGFESGDLIQKINGTPVKTWDEFKKILHSIGEGTAKISVERFATKEVKEISAPTKMIPNDNVLSS